MDDLHKIHEGPPPPESDYFVSDRDGNLVGWLVPVERPLYEIDRKAFAPYWNESHHEALASMIKSGLIRQVAGRKGKRDTDER